VEVVRGPETSDDTVARVAGWVKALGKYPVVVGDAPGFLVNRVLMPYLAEAFELQAEGVSIEAVDAAAKAFGMPMGPFRLLDEVGLDVAAHVNRTFAEAFPMRFPTSALVLRLVAEGRLGKKARKGFFDYGARGRERPWSDLPASTKSLEPRIVQDRLFLRMADE